MKYLIFILTCVNLFAQNVDAQIAAFDEDNLEFEEQAYSNERILQRVEQDMKLACDESGLCTLSGVSNTNHEFTTTFHAGVGNPLFQGYGGSGTTVVIPGNTQSQSSSPFLGLQVSFTHSNCTQEIKVPKSVYLALNRYMYGLLQEDGDIQRSFDPAKEAMVMFYTTIISKLSSCQ